MQLAVYSVSTSMAAYMVVGVLNRYTSEDRVPFKLGSEWVALNDAWAPETPERSPEETLGLYFDPRLTRRLFAWNRAQTLDELVLWTAPTAEFLLIDALAPFTAISDRPLWLLERFTETYLGNWSLSSLKLEWDYIHSDNQGCVPSDQMALRRLDVSDVAKEIARRVSDTLRADDEPAKIGVDDFTTIAVEYLSEERYEAAATIYEGLHSLRSDDATILNNLGFCLMPVRLERAVEVLEQSMLVASKPNPVTYANLALAKYLSGYPDEALSLARRGQAHRVSGRVWLWTVDDGGKFSLESVVNIRMYFQALADKINKRAGMSDLRSGDDGDPPYRE